MPNASNLTQLFQRAQAMPRPPQMAVNKPAPPEKKKILIVGSGEIGHALATVLSTTPHDVCIWDRNPIKCAGVTTLAEAVQQAHAIFVCVPSSALREVLAQLHLTLRPTTTLFCMAKGVEATTHLTTEQVMYDVLPGHEAQGLLYGPMIAEELEVGLGGHVVVASHDARAAFLVRSLFEGTDVTTEYQGDVHTIALLGILKNVYAILFGVASGAGWQANRVGWLLVKVIAEMRELIATLGGQGVLVTSGAGLGDLVATALSPNSKNHQVGEALWRLGNDATAVPGSEHLDSEGIRTLPILLEMLPDALKPKLPLLHGLAQIVNRRAKPQIVLQQLLK